MSIQHVFVAAIFALGCSAQSEAQGPVRSPSRDYPHEPPRTADGQVVGADNKAPAALLEEQGTSDGPAPGWTIDEHGVDYDPKRPAGASDAAAEPKHRQKGPAAAQ